MADDQIATEAPVTPKAVEDIPNADEQAPEEAATDAPAAVPGDPIELVETDELQPGQELDEVKPKDVKVFIKDRVSLAGLDPSAWTEAHDEVIKSFVSESKRLLIIYIDQLSGLCCENNVPYLSVNEIAYFVKRYDSDLITVENFFEKVQYGTLNGGHIHSLLRLMSGIYAPIFFENTSWPDSIKNDFSAQLHRFLASLTDTRWKLDGKTVLYIPTEGLNMESDMASKNKELVQRLETAMIHWTRQIKEVLSAQDALQTSENAGPLEEIEFWKNRCVDLSGISDQLDKSGVKKITEIIELAKSSYVTPFKKLSGQIKEGSHQAQSNLMFLKILQDPCVELSDAHPRDIPPMLPKILNLIRMIWVNSEFYKTRERLTGIFRKLSNEIIRRCCKEIDLDKIFDGYVQSSITTLNQCIECCTQWKEIYDRIQRLHHKFSPSGWVLDKSSIFAQVDAFVQRCKDLLEVCECQIHFARMEEGEKTPMPHFAGQRGPEIVRGLLEIETVFEKNLNMLRNVKKTILDVKATSWHDDYNRFRAGMKDLEVMMQNVITSAFDTVTTVEGGVEVLDVFMHLSSREAIKRTIDKKTVDVYQMFNEELNAVKKELTQKTVKLRQAHPKCAGQAHWARFLKKRVERSMGILDRAHFLPNTGWGAETRTQYQQLCQALDDYIRKTFYEWTQLVDKGSIEKGFEPVKLLESPLMARSAEKQGMIDMNFDKLLLKLFQEIHYWERLMFEIPHYAADAYTKREDLRNLREHVLLVVRDYNRIIAALSVEERGLFRERIKFLDKKIHAGLTKLTWASKGISEYFVNDCRVHAGKVQTIVDSYKGANMNISKTCKTVSETLLVRIDNKKIYENLEFEEDQKRHRITTQQKLQELHDHIIRTMRETYQVFKTDGAEVQSHWVRYTEKMDRMVEEAFRLNVKWSLQELSKAINGDGKSAPNPLFKVQVILEGDKVEFAPTLKQLASIVGSICGHLTTALGNINRLPDLLTRKKSHKDPIYKVISRDEEVNKTDKSVNLGMQTNAQNLQNYLSTWDNYREIWEINKDAFIRRYQKLNPQVSSFDADIARYTEVANNVQSQETILNIQFVLLDCSPLKNAILGHTLEWQNKFTSLLKEIATVKLKELHTFLISNGEKVSQTPQTLEQLGESLSLWEQLNADQPKIEAKFQPLYDQFSIMEKYEVLIEDEVKEMLNNLSNDWVKFQQTLIDADVMLKKNKEKFKTGLLAESEEFKKSVANLVDEFNTKGPFASNIPSAEAIAGIESIKASMQALKDKEATLRKGLGIFKIDQPPSKEIAKLESDLEQLQTIWELTKDWEEHWGTWKSGGFGDLDTKPMEELANSSYKKLLKMSKELKDKNWEILEISKNKVDQFRRTMPLINDLKNKAMRPRHWDEIQNEMGRQFDHSSMEFTLEKIIEWGFDQYADKISDISGAATKELAIEIGIQEISDTWEQIELDITTYKDKGHYKLRSTEDVFTALEDNQVKLSTMKASRFVKAFEADVDKWERTLSHILEVVEMLLQVQRQWMYLENIFLGEDIRRQLPRESAEFDEVNSNWKVIMKRLFETKNALRGTHHEGQLEQLNEMNGKLEEIQKSLDMYLETKRQIFPRFYFLSNDDLLEILGQSKNPEAVQPHLKKCFDNIKSLDMAKMGITQKYEATAMKSTDGEVVAFVGPTTLEGPVEAWLCDIEKNMRVTLKEELKKCKANLRRMLSKRDKWVKEHPGQMCITASQIQWTGDVSKALGLVKDRGDQKPLKSLKKKQIAMLSKFSEAIRSNLTKIQRLKIVALVTVEVHARDIIDQLIKKKVADAGAFEWQCQLRLYWEKERDDCIIRQTNTQFQYGYEYLGNSGRLVITALSDRCYMTLTTALHLHRGGSPKGPAGTGKTETTKDLGKALGMYVIVVNCSEGLDYKSMGRMFSGLAQTGAWGCFDEFNRINIEVLSVVAQQILSILSALAAGSQRFVFEGREIKLEWSCGIFITMNPGYAGRTELPDNLKSMFRPISMVVPDSTLIAEIILFGEGFGNTKLLAKKVYTLYSLAVQQLSKQDHYDFGLRALVSVLRYAGRKKRSNPNMPDEELLLLSMKDMNVAKLTSVDLPLFNGIVSDLFPGVETPGIDYSKIKKAIVAELQEMKMQCIPHIITKIIQLYETKTSRHSVMIVGNTLAGKTVSWRGLQATMTRLNKEGDPNFQAVRDYPLNPKALSLGELYGEFDLNTNEWTDGVLSSVMRQTCADEKPEEKWLVFDGPVDTLWIESMNSVMDDNKILTLINGERISMPDQVSLLFEVGDLSVASPATVSRCGMVYYDYPDLGWQPYVDSWLDKKKSQKGMVEELRRLFDKFVVKILDFIKVNHCKEIVEISELNGIISLCRLFDILATPENGVDSHDPENFSRMVELWFQFCMIWSICCSVDEDGRKKIDNYIREMEGTFPNKDTIYEYHVDPKGKTWVHWEEKLRAGWKYDSKVPFFKIIVPTVDMVRYQFLTESLIMAKHPVLLVGPVGTGKTSVATGVYNKMDPKKFSILTVNMSAQTSSNNVQDIIESRVEKRTKGVYVPVGGKKMLTFMDDFNMPAKDTFGSQPPLELMKLWIDYGFWYDRLKQTIKYVRDMFLLAAMGPPGGGRQHISTRLQSRFNLINMTFPAESQIKRIFGSMINQKLADFEEEVKPIGDIMTQATIEMYDAIVAKFLPTPTKIHYLFNMRDISRVFQGLLRAHKDFHDTKPAMTRLWIHECFRVFHDRLINDTDKQGFVEILSEKLGVLFDQTYHNICPNKQPPIFGDYMGVNETYEDIADIVQLKKHMNTVLEEYNSTPGVVQQDLVLFRDAIEHVSKIVRVIRQPRGNMLLIGIGGSGRQSLTRLASFICEYSTFQIEVSKHYRRQEFRDDLRRLYWQTGVENKPTVFLFVDTQVVEEAFLEDINNILSSGEVPSLYKPDEFEEVKTALTDDLKKAGIDDTPTNVFNFLLERVQANLHLVLGMSPVGEAFRNRIRQYPAFVNCTTIDWFSEWPYDALIEVADKYLESIEMANAEEDKLKPNLAKIFAMMHKSVSDMSAKMFDEMKRHNYVTPTNYLELVAGYRELLHEKRKELGDAANKLKNGLFKIDETRSKVEAMSIELEDAKKKVAQFQKQCEEYLVVIVQQKREADEQQKSVAQKSEKIAEEEVKCQHMADLAQHDLDEALPALEAAMKALESLNKKDIGEIKSYGRPPVQVEMVMEAVMILRGQEPTWGEAKRQLGDGNFIKQLMNFEKDNISDRVLKKIGQYVSKPDFDPAIVGRVSLAAQSLCMWVRAMDVYGRVYRVVEPKRQRLNAAQSQLKEKQAMLQEAKDKLAEVEAKMAELQQQYTEKLKQKEELKEKAEHTEKMLHRASQLVSGLAGERERWEETVAELEEKMGYLIGDVLIASAFLSYAGPFLSNYRDDLVQKTWMVEIQKLAVPYSPAFSFCDFMVDPTKVREWNIQGLPSDGFSTENGVIVSRGRRWPLMVDPQGQAIKWIKNMETQRGLKVIDLQQSDYMRQLETAIQFGLPVLLQNVHEVLDPSLDPILNKSIIKIGGAPIIRLGDKEVEYNYEFRFYITTKLSNPHYAPEIATKSTIVNFAVKQQGLEAQLLGIVVRKERPDLEEQKDNLVLNIAAGKKKLKELEDEILRLLNEAQGSLLDDEKLVNTLQTSKATSQDVGEQLATAEQTEAKIDAAREGYRPCAQRASILFFVLNDMGLIDPMYVFSLDSYIELFNVSIDKSQRSSKLEERITNLNDYHTYAVYKYTCLGLFERHKLLFSFHMCARVLEAAGKLNMDEYDFFLRGGVVLDRENQMDNPVPWLPDIAWDNITELDKQTNFHGVITAFEQYPRDWNIWFTAAEPEMAPLPGEWDNACNELQRMLIVRSLRPDRVSFCITSFIINNIGSKFVEPPVAHLPTIVEDSTTRTPLIFVLSPGVDPTSKLLQLAETSDMASRFHALSLGQGQAPIATRMIKEGVREGNWVYLANCHLSLSWMPQLDKLVEQLQVEEPHPEFRLWLSSSPNPEFPISILQTGIKMTTEPPKGIKANIARLYQLITDQQFIRCQKPDRYKKLLFCLCYFHSVLLERRKFLMLGWNIPYEFNDSDFEVSENLLSLYLDEYEDTPWEALKYLIAGINYGGHVTDDMDRRLLLTYINDFFQEDAIAQPFFKLSSLPTYYIPKDGPLSSYKEYISMLPNMDHPEAFGQHPNADITSQIQETRMVFATLLGLQPAMATGAGESREDKVLGLAESIKNQMPENIDYDTTAKILSVDPSPLNVVLLQEIERYNKLLNTIRAQLTDLERGIQGLVVMSSDLEEIFTCIFDGRVPSSWQKAYPSLKPLASWTRDLVARVEHFEKWATTAHPPMVFWLSAFTFPTGFLTAVLQTAARQNNISVDLLSWEYTVLTVSDSNLTGPPKDGVYCKGMYLQGAGWDQKNSCLVEADPMQLVCPIPTIHFKPAEVKRRSQKGIYTCPIYYYANRAGSSGRASFIVAAELKSGDKPADHWCKRGTALLMSLDN